MCEKTNNSDLKTKHNLEFEARPGRFAHMEYRVGTVTGQWGTTSDSYYVLSFLNHEPNNGHLDDVFEWFEFSCKRDENNLIILECFNERFYQHLLSKRDFKALDKGCTNAIKVFNTKAYKRMLRVGNKIIQPKTLRSR